MEDFNKTFDNYSDQSNVNTVDLSTSSWLSWKN